MLPQLLLAALTWHLVRVRLGSRCFDLSITDKLFVVFLLLSFSSWIRKIVNIRRNQWRDVHAACQFSCRLSVAFSNDDKRKKFVYYHHIPNILISSDENTSRSAQNLTLLWLGYVLKGKMSFSRSTSPLPLPVNHRSDCISAATKRYKYLRRIMKFDQMDFQFAAWQMFYLFVAPQKVYRNFMYRKRKTCKYGSCRRLPFWF